jgi:protein-disulfide isomerase
MTSRVDEKRERREERQRAEAQAAERERRQRLVKVISAAVFLAVIAVVVAIIASQSGGGSGGGGTDIAGVGKVNSELSGLQQNGSVLGDPAAKKTLIEYGDLQCPTCKLYADEVMPRFFSGPVSSGEAKIDFRPWSIIGPDSTPAAEAAYAAGEQGRFWTFIELFYLNQGQENSGYVTDDFLTAVAKAAGVKDIAQWNQDRKDPRWKRMIDAHDRQAAALGFTRTPSFAIQSSGGPVRAISKGSAITSPSAIAAAIAQG